MNSKPRPPALTIERFASDCPDVLMLNRANAFRDQRVTVSFPFRWPKITNIRVTRYGILLTADATANPGLLATVLVGFGVIPLPGTAHSRGLCREPTSDSGQKSLQRQHTPYAGAAH